MSWTSEILFRTEEDRANPISQKRKPAMKKSMILSLMILLTNSFASADAMKAAETYKNAGKGLMSMINSGKVDPAAAEKAIYEMVDAAKVVAEGYAKADPKASKLVKYVTENIPKLKTLSFEQLEKDWHDGAALKPDLIGLDLKKEENEKYTDPVHCLVHPLMTLAALKKNDLKGAKEELAEGLEQMESIKSVIGK